MPGLCPSRTLALALALAPAPCPGLVPAAVAQCQRFAQAHADQAPPRATAQPCRRFHCQCTTRPLHRVLRRSPAPEARGLPVHSVGRLAERRLRAAPAAVQSCVCRVGAYVKK